MKNQYFGDVNDYVKYGLLRLLGGNGHLGLAVCWVLTRDDSMIDGRRVGYLKQPDTWQKYDPQLFCHLRDEVIDKGNRRVSVIEEADVLKNCRFFDEQMQDDGDKRDDYFERFFRFAEGVDFVFFDPDNGLGVKSVPRGKKGSSKYVYRDELETAYNHGYSILLYQHFPRRPREPFIRDIVRQFRGLKGIRWVVSFSSSHVVFLLFPQPHHENVLHSNAIQVANSWGNMMQVKIHRVLRASTKPRGRVTHVSRDVELQTGVEPSRLVSDQAQMVSD